MAQEVPNAVSAEYSTAVEERLKRHGGRRIKISIETLSKGNLNTKLARSLDGRFNRYFYRYQIPEHQRKEYYSAAGEAIAKALHTFEPGKGTKITTWIVTNIINSIAATRAQLFKDSMMYGSAEQEYDPTIQLGEEEEKDFLDTLESGDPSPEQIMIEEEESSAVYEAMSTLPESDQKILCEYYGVGGSEPRTQMTLAKQYGVTQAAIHYKLRKAAQRLEAALFR